MAGQVRAEDGRSVCAVDISPFIADLPFGKRTDRFSTSDASGSTSQAISPRSARDLAAICPRSRRDLRAICARSRWRSARDLRAICARSRRDLTSLTRRARSGGVDHRRPRGGRERAPPRRRHVRDQLYDTRREDAAARQVGEGADPSVHLAREVSVGREVRRHDEHLPY